MFKYFFIFISFLSFFLVVGQTPQKTVVAKRGDGIYSLFKKNNINIKYIKEFIALNQKNLRSNNGLFIGQTYILPITEKDTTVIDSITPKIESTPSKLKIKNTLFGDHYSDVIVEDKKLEGAIYYLISGHGGPDPGATETYNGKLISEDEYAYDVTLRLARKLLSNGAKVYIIIKDLNDGIRDKRILEVDYDEVSHPNNKIPRNQRLRLRQRTQAINNLYVKHKGAYQRLIVTHVDSRSKGKNIDVFFYHHINSKKGKRLAENIHNSFKQKYAEHQPNRQYTGSVSSRSGLYLIKNTLPAMVYIELGNIKNQKDQKRILNYQNREALANWIHNGLLNDFIKK